MRAGSSTSRDLTPSQFATLVFEGRKTKLGMDVRHNKTNKLKSGFFRDFALLVFEIPFFLFFVSEAFGNFDSA